MTIGVAGDIVFPIYCRWGDGEFYEMFFLRYDRARETVDLIHRDPDSHEFSLDSESKPAPDVDYIDPADFSTDTLFSGLATILDVALLTTKQAGAVAADPDDDDVWVPVDVGQEPIEFATDDEVS